MRLKLALVVIGVLAAIAVTGASAADFDGDGGVCRETPGDGQLLLCPTAYVGTEYEIEIESEEGSGCSPNYDYFVIVNSSLPPGLTMSRDGVISGVPTSAGFTRFWIHNHDLTEAQGGPSWCQRDDVSEREFSMYVDPGLEIENESLAGATIAQAYAGTLTANTVVSVNPTNGGPAPAVWSVLSGSLPPGVVLSAQGLLTGTPTSEGSYGFAVKAQNGGAVDTKQFTLAVRQPLVVKSPFESAPRPNAEVGLRLLNAATATGGSGTYTWSVSAGSLPTGVALNPSKGTLSGTPQAAGNFAFGLTATDTEGRATTAASVLNVAPRLAIRTLRLKPATVARPYRAALGSVGGVKPVSWKVVGGKLPSGVQLSQTLGTLAGTPRRAGTYRVTVGARDALGARSQRTLVLRVTN